jgi:tripartite-type tricarboxylate transporter receptor subunit TctC
MVAKINGEVRNIFADANVQKDFLDAQYFEPIADSPEQLSQRIRTEEPKWHKLIDDAHIKLE